MMGRRQNDPVTKHARIVQMEGFVVLVIGIVATGIGVSVMSTHREPLGRVLLAAGLIWLVVAVGLLACADRWEQLPGKWRQTALNVGLVASVGFIVAIFGEWLSLFGEAGTGLLGTTSTPPPAQSASESTGRTDEAADTEGRNEYL